MEVQICFRGFQSVFRWYIWKFRLFSLFSVCFPLIYLKNQICFCGFRSNIFESSDFFFVVFSLFSADKVESSDLFSWFSVCFPLIFLKVQTFVVVFSLFSADMFESSDFFVVFGLKHLKIQIFFRSFQSVFRWYIWKFRFFCSFQSVFRWYIWKFRFVFVVFSLFSADIFESSDFFRSFQSVFRWYIWKFRFFCGFRSKKFESSDFFP